MSTHNFCSFANPLSLRSNLIGLFGQYFSRRSSQVFRGHFRGQHVLNQLVSKLCFQILKFIIKCLQDCSLSLENYSKKHGHGCCRVQLSSFIFNFYFTRYVSTLHRVLFGLLYISSEPGATAPLDALKSLGVPPDF